MNTPHLSPPSNRIHLMPEPITISTNVRKHAGESHYHNFCQMFYTLAGEFPHTINGKTYLQKTGCCAFVLPYVSHTTVSINADQNPISIGASFSDRFLTNHGYSFFSYSKNHAFFEGMKIPPFTIFEGSKKDEADTLMRKLRNEFDKHKEMSYSAIADTLSEFLRLLCTQHYTPAAIPKNSIIERANAINDAVTYLAEHFNEKISIDRLAETALMSRRSFFRNFEEVTGTTVTEMLSRFRIKQSLPLLLYTEKTLDEIARDVGLYDKSRYSKVFFEIHGISPQKYRTDHLPTAFRYINNYKRQWRWVEDPDYDEQENTQ